MPAQPKGELVVVGFDYTPLDAQVAERLQSAAERIRGKLKRTLEDIIEIGNDLLAVKESLAHGQFGKWLRAEFGWGDRMARNFMSVAERFGKTATIADLKIAPTAAYLLAGPSVPDEARQRAIERAEGGEEITPRVAKKILAETRKKGKKKIKRVPAEQLGPRLVKVLERYRQRWNPQELAAFTQQLREFADTLDEQKGGRKTKKE